LSIAPVNILQRKLALESKKSDIMSRSEKIVSGIIRKRGKDPKTCSDEEKKSVLDEILLQAELNPLQEQNMLVEQPVGKLLELFSLFLTKFDMKRQLQV